MTPPNPPHGIEPCPFCSSGDEEMRPVACETREGFVVICTACSALGPTRRCSALAIAAWNTRTSPHTGLTDVEGLRTKLRMVISHASGGALSEPGDVDRSTNDICVEISRHKNEIWKHAQEVALRDLSNTSVPVTVSEGMWQPIETAPHACHFLAARFEGDWGEWTYSIVMRDRDWENLNNWTHWRPLPEPPALAMSADNREGR